LIDLFIYWDVPEYANQYASEAILVETNMTAKNPMVSAQTYISKGRALLKLGELDSVAYYTEKARELCRQLPYNSGMVDVDLLHGTYLTEKGGDAMHLGIQELEQVTLQGTDINRARAYHQLAQTYLRSDDEDMAEVMLESMYMLLNQNDSPALIDLDYKSIINHYIKVNDQQRVEQYTQMMLEEQQALKAKRLNYNLIDAIVDSQTEQQSRELQISQLEQANQRLLFIIYIVFSLVIISVIVVRLIHQRRVHKIQIERADNKLANISEELKQTHAEKEIISQKIDDIIDDMESRQELETLTPSVLQNKGETKFRQRFELLYPLFLPHLREKVPNITRREELLSMLIVLKQDNKGIAELLAIAPRSVLMLRHRFRQKIGMTTELSLEEFIEELLKE
jgi:DNA-binding CsgD family transcriptional regulator